MSDIAISVENLSKSYLVGHNSAQAERYTALRDVVSRNARNLARKTRDMFSGRAIVQGDEVEEFWALKDVSFEVKRGEVLGIIGRNGAGKSTLLKILSRITEPTSGRIKIAGRVASLLEVGTGFHPELSGRENIFLNGAILGMRREEIVRKFDEIVDFSGVEKFLDTPVKRYSSGMYVRLAFAVAAHLEPEILIIDEVLAVGDAEFQKKCLGKMQDVGKEGRTVLFVSHNLAAVRNLCSSALLLDKGAVISIGSVGTVLADYMDKGAEYTGVRNWEAGQQPGNELLRLSSLSVYVEDSGANRPNEEISHVIDMNIEASHHINDVDFGITIINEGGVEVVHTASCTQLTGRKINIGSSVVRYELPVNVLKSGIYSLSVSATIPNQYFFFDLRDSLSFRICTKSIEGSVYPDDAWKGVLSPAMGTWSFGG